MGSKLNDELKRLIKRASWSQAPQQTAAKREEIAEARKYKQEALANMKLYKKYNAEVAKQHMKWMKKHNLSQNPFKSGKSLSPLASLTTTHGAKPDVKQVSAAEKYLTRMEADNLRVQRVVSNVVKNAELASGVGDSHSSLADYTDMSKHKRWRYMF